VKEGARFLGMYRRMKRPKQSSKTRKEYGFFNEETEGSREKRRKSWPDQSVRVSVYSLRTLLYSAELNVH